MKKLLILCCLIIIVLSSSHAQPGTWTWMKGDTVINQLGNYGVQGVADSLNKPPALYSPMTWTDNQGYFWMYGGMLYAGGVDIYEDMWRYDPATNEWTWIQGSGIPNQNSVHGIMGLPAPGNHPGSRAYGAPTWIDLNGNLWMFGGLGHDDNGILAKFNDLWKFDVATFEWTWMKGPKDAGNGLYQLGTIGVEDTANFPFITHECTANWVDNNGALWYFGGATGSSSSGSAYMWRYNIATNAWTCIRPNGSGNYGVQGVDSVTNNPPPRCAYCGFKTTNDYWIFGGNQEFSYPTSYNDIWKYSFQTTHWTWMNGANVQNYGVSFASVPVCVPRTDTFPSARHENRGCWIDANGIFWMFGGYRRPMSGTIRNFYDDWWVYNPTTNNWAYMDGRIAPGPSNYTPHYGVMGMADTLNTPAGRAGYGKWVDTAGNYWIYGGFIYRSGLNIEQTKGDLWKYIPDLQCALISTTEDINSLPAISAVVYPNPASSTFTISISKANEPIEEVKIYNILGAIEYAKIFSSGNFSKEISVANFSNGIYFVQLKTNGRILSNKMVVQH